MILLFFIFVSFLGRGNTARLASNSGTTIHFFFLGCVSRKVGGDFVQVFLVFVLILTGIARAWATNDSYRRVCAILERIYTQQCELASLRVCRTASYNMLYSHQHRNAHPPFCPSRPAPPRSDLHVASKKIGAGSAGCQSRCGRSTLRITQAATGVRQIVVSLIIDTHSFVLISSSSSARLASSFLSGRTRRRRHFLFFGSSSSSSVCVCVAQTDKSSISFAPLPIPPLGFFFIPLVSVVFFFFSSLLPSSALLFVPGRRQCAVPCAICIPTSKRKKNRQDTHQRPNLN